MKIAVVGCGKQAVKHIAGFRKCDGVEMVLVDREPALARALAEQEKLPWVETIEQALSQVGAVDLCVPTPFHSPLIRQSLAAGKDFFCEKPLCESAADAQEIDALTAAAQRVGMVGYVYRHAPVFQKVQSILEGADQSGRSPVLGQISVALMRIGGRGSAAVWKHRQAHGGGAINEMLVHMLDLAVWYFGPMQSAERLMQDVFRPQRAIAGKMEDADAEDFVIARFMSRSGVPVVIQADLLTPSFTQSVEIQGDNGTLMASIQSDMPQFVFTIKEAGGYPAGRTALQRENVNFFDAQMATFVSALRERPANANITLRDSVEVMRALEALKTSA